MIQSSSYESPEPTFDEHGEPSEHALGSQVASLLSKAQLALTIVEIEGTLCSVQDPREQLRGILRSVVSELRKLDTWALLRRSNR